MVDRVDTGEASMMVPPASLSASPTPVDDVVGGVSREGNEEGLGDLVSRTFMSMRIHMLASVKPYFSSLDTRTVFRRLTYSVIPRRKVKTRDRSRSIGSSGKELGTMEIVEYPDLYSPVMLVLSLSALLRPYEDNLRIPFIACAFYWIATSAALFIIGVILAVVSAPTRSVSTRMMSLTQTLSVIGYSLFGAVLVIFAVSFTGGPDSSMFYPSFLTFGVGSALCLGLRMYKGVIASQINAAGMAACAMIVHVWWIRHVYLKVLSLGDA